MKSENSPSRTHARQACTREEFQPPYRPMGNGGNKGNKGNKGNNRAVARVRTCARTSRSVGVSLLRCYFRNGAHMVTIEKGIPVPDGEWRRYPWATMEVGESFYVAGKADANRAWSAARVQAMRTTQRFKQQRDPDGSRRIWRLA